MRMYWIRVLTVSFLLNIFYTIKFQKKLFIDIGFLAVFKSNLKTVIHGFCRAHRVLILYEHRLHPLQKYIDEWGSQEEYCSILQRQNLLWKLVNQRKY